MKTDLKDITGRKLKLGDTIAMCGWNYSLNKFGKRGNEYCFHTGKVYFKKGRVQWTGHSEYDNKLFDENFLIIRRKKKLFVRTDKTWDWQKMNMG